MSIKIERDDEEYPSREVIVGYDENGDPIIDREPAKYVERYIVTKARGSIKLEDIQEAMKKAYIEVPVSLIVRSEDQDFVGWNNDGPEYYADGSRRDDTIGIYPMTSDACPVCFRALDYKYSEGYEDCQDDWLHLSRGELLRAWENGRREKGLWREQE